MQTTEKILEGVPLSGNFITEGGLFSLIVKSSHLILFLFTTVPGLCVVGAVVGIFFMVRFFRELRQARLLARGAGSTFSYKEGIFLFFETLLHLVPPLVTALPTLFMVGMLGLSVVTLGKTLEQIEGIVQAQRRIRELQTVLKHLEATVRVADLTIHTTVGDRIRFSIDFYNPANPMVPAEHRELELPGRELFIDAIVCNFEYSEIAAGRKVNLAIPYRVFSDEIPQAEGIPLGGMDAKGIPYMYYRSDEDIYGMTPALYRERLQELMELVRSDSRARPAGIIRSLYGSAIHRRVSPGARYEIRIEQTGGLTLKEKFSF
ncbi:MAG: hypothetical protein N2Z76_03810 [Treponemataceae bacterium]|nr:hypothetical protein [Treponemataceae bacterium]